MGSGNMQGLPRSLRRWHLATAGLGLCVMVSARPQATTPPSGASSGNNQGRATGIPTGNRGMGGDFPTFDPNFSHRQMVARREDLKKHMVDNAARLLTLTHDLQTELQDRQPNEADAKRLEEIAKLARSVRDQMRQ